MTLTTALEDPEAIMPRRDIVRMLDEYEVPWKSWGTGSSRTLGDLYAYHERDRLYFRNGNGHGVTPKFVIDVHAAIVIVFHQYRRQWLELYEDRQEFPTGPPVRRRGFNGIAETLKRDETFRQGAERCLKEELNFHDPSLYKLSDCIKVEHRKTMRSEKWPGVWAAYHRHIFECVISRPLFRRDGYVEREDRKTIYFKWKPSRQLLFHI